LRIQYKPFVAWIWSGVLAIALGGFLAAFDRHYRVRRAASEQVSQLTSLEGASA
jgi:cytochrome c-type biogenesis protein CcmF